MVGKMTNIEDVRCIKWNIVVLSFRDPCFRALYVPNVKAVNVVFLHFALSLVSVAIFVIHCTSSNRERKFFHPKCWMLRDEFRSSFQLNVPNENKIELLKFRTEITLSLNVDGNICWLWGWWRSCCVQPAASRPITLNSCPALDSWASRVHWLVLIWWTSKSEEGRRSSLCFLSRIYLWPGLFGASRPMCLDRGDGGSRE